jgi:TetR/AcrR family transcriptional regulator, regulator of cefoperazone and chloramphenicol sensitivity
VRPISDMTARARIRDAAMRRLAQHGAKATTIRAVADEAGVTPGLISHHFGTKQGLREACDAYVLGYLREGIAEAIDERGLADPGYLGSVYESAPLVLRYLARALIDGSTAAAALFDNVVALTEEYLASHPPQQGASQADPRAQATVLIAMRLGMWVLHDHLVRALGADALTPEVLSRVSAALVDIMSPEFVGSDLLALARTGLARFQTTTGSE